MFSLPRGTPLLFPYEFEKFVARTDFIGHGNGHARALRRLADGVAVVVVNLGGGEIHHARGGTRDEQLVADLERVGIHRELGHANLREILHAATNVDLSLRGARAVGLVLFAEPLPLIVAVPEASVEHAGQTLVPLVLACFGEERLGLLTPTPHPSRGEGSLISYC